jgi:N-acyl-D-aspartate/D-glutamate deacylase
MPHHDLIVRGGLVADGLGGEPFVADIAIDAGKITAIGALTGSAEEEINASGLLVTPGFVDVHTHYDGQVAWDNRLTPSSFNGVTTAVMGNCGVGFAPVRPDGRDSLLELMEGVEDIPGAVLRAGLGWQWETFGDYLDFLGSRQYDMDVAAMIPHAALRLYVMGERAWRHEEATPDDIAEMHRLVVEAIRAGAIGFSTSRSTNHRSVKGAVTPTYKASEAELLAIANAMAEAGGGVFEFASSTDPTDQKADFAMFRRIGEASGIPITFAVAQMNGDPEDWRETLQYAEDAQANGITIVPQFPLRPVGAIISIEGSSNPFRFSPTYVELVSDDAVLGDKVARLRDPAVREKVLAETMPHAERPVIGRFGRFERLFAQSGPLDYEPDQADSIGAVALRAGLPPLEVLYDAMHKGSQGQLIYFPTLNYANYNLDHVGEMLRHPNTVPGLGDGGAHVGIIADASSLLLRWAKPLNPYGFELGWVIKRHTADCAALFGLIDRGVLAAGMKADLNVIDLDRLGLQAPEMVRDLPAGGKRLLQRTTGYVATIVSGKVVSRDGQSTDLLPGRVVRPSRTIG